MPERGSKRTVSPKTSGGNIVRAIRSSLGVLILHVMVALIVSREHWGHVILLVTCMKHVPVFAGHMLASTRHPVALVVDVSVRHSELVRRSCC